MLHGIGGPDDVDTSARSDEASSSPRWTRCVHSLDSIYGYQAASSVDYGRGLCTVLGCPNCSCFLGTAGALAARCLEARFVLLPVL